MHGRYQMVGVNWLYLLRRHEKNGMLADEMGLGKTVQTIAFLLLLQSRIPEARPHLIIVPNSTLHNWHREISKWAPNLEILLYVKQS